MPSTTLPKDFDLLGLIGGNGATNVPGTNTSIVLRPGEVTVFQTANGEEAQIKTDEMKLIRLETINSERNKDGIVNLQGRIFWRGEIQDKNGKAHPYCLLGGYSEIAKEIRGQFWQASQAGARQMYNILSESGWTQRANIAPSKQRGGTNGILLRATPPRPSDGDFDNYGMHVEAVTVSQTYDPQNNADGFQDFWTSADEMYNELVVIQGLSDEGVKAAAYETYRRHARMICGGRAADDGWPKAAQFTAFQLVGQPMIDLWTAGMVHDLDDLLAAKQVPTTPVVPAAGTAEEAY